MSGGILQAARADFKKFITTGGFQEEIILSTPDGSTVINTTGLATKHHINFDTDGNPVNSKNVHICIDESDLVAKGYTVRNSAKEVALLNHLVSFPDNTGIIKNYKIRETLPDETLGGIVCLLEDYIQ